jgi:hypothetical protein
MDPPVGDCNAVRLEDDSRHPVFAGFQSPRASCGAPDLTWNGLAEVAPAE